MSLENKNNKKVSLLRNSLLLTAFVFVASLSLTQKDDQESHEAHKAHKVIRHTSKLKSPFYLKVKSDSEKIYTGDVFELTGELHSGEILKNYRFKWVIPEGIEIINGDLEPFINDVQKNQKVEFKITLKANTEVNKVIHFVARNKINESVFSNSIQFHTQAQSRLANANKELSLRAKSYKATR